MKTSTGIILGLCLVAIITLLGVLIAIWTYPIDKVKCDYQCTDYGKETECFVYTQKIGDYLLGRD